MLRITFIVHTSPKLLLIWTFALAKINTMHISVVKILPSKYNYQQLQYDKYISCKAWFANSYANINQFLCLSCKIMKINCFGNRYHTSYHCVHEMANTHGSCCMVAISRCVFRGKFSMPNIHPMFPFWFLLVSPGEKSATDLQRGQRFK